MSIYFDFKTINELFEDNYYRQVKQDTSKFTPDDWIRYIAPLVTYSLGETTQGMNKERSYQKFILLGVLVGLGKTPQEAISQVQQWQNTGVSQLLKSGTSTGTSGNIGAQGSTGTSGGTMPTNRQISQDKSKFTPDDWIRYIAPLVIYALKETTQGANTQRAYNKFILSGVLVGLGKTPQEAINQVQEWQNTGASQLLKSGTSTGASGGISKGGMGSTGTSGGMGTGGMGSSGTSGGIGTGGTGSLGTSGGIGIGGMGSTGTSGGIGSGGIGSTGTSGGIGTGGTGSTGTSDGIGTGSMGSSGTSGGMGTGGIGSSGTSGGIGTGGTGSSGTSGGIGTGGTGSSGTSGGIITGGMGTQGNTATSGNTMPTNQVKQDTSKFTPDDWIRYITPLVTYSLRETTQGMNTQNAYQKFILLGVLVGLGKTPDEAINQVQEWQNTGASQLLKSGTSTGTSGNIGTGVTGSGGSSDGTGTGFTGSGGSSGGTGTGVTGSGAGTSGYIIKRNRLYFD
ncbi:MAG TPA: hypothetical protein VF839_06700 [Clostridium sp.]